MYAWSFALARLVVFATFGLTSVAVLLGRQAQRAPGDGRDGVPPPSDRREAPARYQPLNVHVFGDSTPALHLLDTETGGIECVRLPREDRIDFAACSAWRDDRGRRHIGGRWTSVDGSGVRAAGLARVAFPGGEFLDRIELDSPPVGDPCWLPGTSARMLITRSDGPLFLVSFERAGAPGSPAGGAGRPVPLTWRCRPPGPGMAMLREPVCSADPRMRGRVIVSVFLELEGGDQANAGARLWWLRLSDDGLVIEETGRLIEPADRTPGEPAVEERFPSVSATPDGRLALAYLAHRRDEANLELRVAELTIDGVTGNPRVEPGAARGVATNRRLARPAFTEQGHWVYSLANEHPLPARADRYSVVDALAGRSDARRDSPPRRPVDDQQGADRGTDEPRFLAARRVAPPSR